MVPTDKKRLGHFPEKMSRDKSPGSNLRGKSPETRKESSEDKTIIFIRHGQSEAQVAPKSSRRSDNKVV